MTDDIPELTERQFARALPAIEIGNGHAVVALRGVVLQPVGVIGKH